MVNPFVEDHLDLLQNLEFAIVDVYRVERALLDLDVQSAVDALVRHYHAEEERRAAPARMLGERAGQVFEAVRGICEWRLGRAAGPGESGATASAVPVETLVRALRQIQKSVRRWNERQGRQGYLDFVSGYVQ